MPKKLLIGVAVFALSILGVFVYISNQTTTNAQTTTGCTDSDLGINYYRMGSTTANTLNGQRTLTDNCYDSTRLNEYYCSAGSDIGTSLYTCPNGCSNGACVSATNPTSTPSPTPALDFSISFDPPTITANYDTYGNFRYWVLVNTNQYSSTPPVNLTASIWPAPPNAPRLSWPSGNTCYPNPLDSSIARCSQLLDVTISTDTPAGAYTITVTGILGSVTKTGQSLFIKSPSPSATPITILTSPTPTPGASPTPSVNPTATPRPSPTPSLTPESVLACMRAAVEKRDNAIIAAWDNLTVAPTSTFATTSIKIALETRTNDVKQAWTITVKKERQTAIRAAWTTFREARLTARNTFRDAKETAWTTFKTEGKVCTGGANITSESIGQDVNF